MDGWFAGWVVKHEWWLAALGVAVVLVVAVFAVTATEESHPFGVVLGVDAGNPEHEDYLLVHDSCDGDYAGDTCVAMREHPSIDSDSVLALRTGMVLKVAETLVSEGRAWYKVAPDTYLRYPERVTSEWYVAADVVQLLQAEGETEITPTTPPVTNKNIVVDRSDQKLYAYENDKLFMEVQISTGLELTPTPRGNFMVYKKTPSRYMQGPLPGISDQYYDLPGVPWNLYFTPEGGVIHGAYWHNNFGQPWSHGCVNLSPELARELYHWAPLGTPVLVRD